MPLLRWPDGTLCEPVLLYFGYSVTVRRTRSVSSLKPEAYSIREWFVFLANKGLDLWSGRDELLEEWRTSQGWTVVADRWGKKRPARSTLIKNARIQRKIKHVFEFYLHLPKAMPFFQGGATIPILVGESGDGYAIGSKLSWDGRLKKHAPIWIRSEKISVPGKPPKVPTKSELTILYSYLRGKGFRSQQKLKLPFPPVLEQVIGDRDWLMARCMAAAGLRCQEVADLTVSQVANALWSSGVTSTVLHLEAILNDQDLQEEIVRKVLSIKDAGELSFILVSITGKGGKSRSAPFPPSLMCDVLRYIWGSRSKQIVQFKDGYQRFISGPVFLSATSYEALKSKSIGNLIGAAYRACGLKGSAHKLRGHFATDTAASLWREYFALNQYRFDQALINQLLDQLAAYMGHEHPSTTTKFYVDQELFRHLARIGTPEAKLFERLFQTVVMQQRKLTDRQSRIIYNITDMVSRSGDTSLLVETLDIIVNDARFSPTKLDGETNVLKLAFESSGKT